MKNVSDNIFKIKKTILFSLLLLGFLTPSRINSQEYRSAKAYIEDFGKNDMYLKKAIMDYSITIVESFLDTRSEVTAKRIVEKLKIINSNIDHHDRGFKGNTVLRDGLLRMNEKTLQAIENKTMVLDDYDSQNELSLKGIIANFNQRESSIMQYFEEINRFERIKKEFGVQYDLTIKNYDENNVFEYCAKQNILFYKMNVLDHKLIHLIINKDKQGFLECLQAIENLKPHVLSKTAELKKDFSDESINDANIEYVNFLSDQNEKIMSYVLDYFEQYKLVQKIKARSKEIQESNKTIAEYNKVVKLFNYKKNILLMLLEENQKNKKKLYNKWYTTNAKFLRNNIVFEDIHEKFVKDK
ncbi:MAG TPA: hypothetical protein DCS17_01210 [Flavobacterium sp.]|nr:hypothetical protein [Flavobacterium sp.]HAT80062.1 hypothetical protein [Flavobacterium sp.]